MQARLTLTVLLLFPILMMAQPTITKDWIGVPGDKIATMGVEVVPDLGSAGRDQVWDFSEVAPDQMPNFLDYAEPSSTQYFDNFPTSNLCLQAPVIGRFSYSILTDSKWESLGEQDNSLHVDNQDPEVVLTFPTDYEDNFQDDYEKTTTKFGVTQYTTGSVDVTADAYGTVVLATGLFNNVMRVKTVDASIDSTDLGLGIIEKIHTTSTTYKWYSPDHPGPLSLWNVTEYYQVGISPPLPNDTLHFAPDTTFFFDPTAVSSSVEFFTVDAFSLEVSPNPFVNSIQLSFTAERSEELRFELQSSNGQLIQANTIAAVSGSNNIEINVTNLPSGSYFAVLSGKEKGSVKQLIKVK